MSRLQAASIFPRCLAFDQIHQTASTIGIGNRRDLRVAQGAGIDGHSMAAVRRPLHCTGRRVPIQVSRALAGATGALWLTLTTSALEAEISWRAAGTIDQLWDSA